jgi:hypothetical protein
MPRRIFGTKREEVEWQEAEEGRTLRCFIT